jgi:ABC-type transport system involved in multi-copper enzyme maturation permease subunit
VAGNKTGSALGDRLPEAFHSEARAPFQAQGASRQGNEIMSIAATTDLEHASTRLLLVPLTSTITCVGLADWLFFGWQIGISLALFLGVLGLVAVATNRTYAPRRVQIAMSVVFVAVLVALVEDISILSAMLGALGTGAFVMEITAREPARWQQCLLEVVVAPFLGPFQFAGDLIWQIRKTNYAWLKLDSLIAWIVPLGIFAVFVWLFATANPLIEHGLLQINPSTLLDLLDPRRMAFWMLLAGVIWPFIFRRNGRISAPKAEVHAEAETAGGPSELGHFLGVSATLRSLILFNALFALQTVLDLTYLWGGASLPNGMSHAEYAHRGAYPLIATALLAAASVLVAMRPGGPAENSRLIRPLVLAWIAQNVLLVISSIFRLDLYVAAYSLTYLRLAALIWMVLVAIGLVLILIQIIRKKSNSWLLAANAISLALVLYACCFLNAPWLIATYNIEHSREISGTGPKLDLWYLVSLGPQAEPALRSHLAEMPGLEPYIQEIRCHRDNSFEYCNYDRQRQTGGPGVSEHGVSKDF